MHVLSPHNPKVGGSNPSRATNIIKHLACLQGPLRWAFLFWPKFGPYVARSWPTYFYGFRFRPLGIGLHGLPIVADPGQQLTSLEAMRQRHPHLQHVLSASCVRWRPALLSHRSTSTLSLLLHFGASQLHRATSVPLVDFIEHPINRSRRVSCCYCGTRSRFPCLRRALFSPCQAWGLKDIDYERFLRETVVNLNCAASASGWFRSFTDDASSGCCFR